MERVLGHSANRSPQVNGRSARAKTPSSELDKDEGDETNDESDGLSETELVEQVIASLSQSKDPVVAARAFANDKQQDDTKVAAYAKIAGRDWTFYVQDQSVNIGRPPDDRPPHANGFGASSPMSDMKDAIHVDIDLGPSKIVSRLHATVFYDAEQPDGGGWHVRVNGRNGVRVNTTLLKRGQAQQITSGTILEISGTQFMFVTPGDPVQIHQIFIDNVRKQGPTDAPPTTVRLFSDRPELPPPPTGPGYQQLAPAPPSELKRERASTPPTQQADPRSSRSVFDSKTVMSPMYGGRGMMMESTQEIDYSRDSARDLKPPFSYATMIAQAIFSTDEEKMTLANIYSFISDKYAFYRFSNSGWQVRQHSFLTVHKMLTFTRTRFATICP